MHLRIHWLLAALFSAGILLAAHIYALDTHLYYTYRWLDIPMHMLGGLTVGLLAIAFFDIRRPRAFLALVLAVAIGWEIFEYIFSISTGQPDYWFDTIHDIVNDMVGGIVAYALARYTVWR